MMNHEEIHKAIQTKFQMKPHGPEGQNPLGTRQKFGDRKLLCQLMAELGFNQGAEIGVRWGDFSERFLQCNPNLHMLCVDPWEPYERHSARRQEKYYKIAADRLSKYNATIVRKRSMDAVQDVPDCSLDFVYIDGNHEYDWAAPDVIFWSQKVRSGGIVMAHDFYFPHNGVSWAILGYIQAHNIRPWYALKTVQPTAFWVKP